MDSKPSYFRLYQLIKSSHYGTILAQNIRFSDFIPAAVNSTRWQRVIGADVNNLKHMWYTKKLTDQFLAYSNRYSSSRFTAKEAHLLRLTATFHDLAESIIGDIAKTRKTAKDEQDERRVLIMLIRKLNATHPELQPLIPDFVSCIDDILFPESPTRLSQAFTIIENLGYLHTACKSWKVAYHAVKPTPLAQGLYKLANEVIPFCLERLEKHTNSFPAINDFLASPHLAYAIEDITQPTTSVIELKFAPAYATN